MTRARLASGWPAPHRSVLGLSACARPASPVVSLFHPRRQAWHEHFSFDEEGLIHGLTPEGRASVQLMDMKDPERLELRSLLVRQGRFSYGITVNASPAGRSPCSDVRRRVDL
jgi:hypothetical protein